MKAKKIKALDTIIAGLEALKECLDSEASKSGDSADDEDTVEVPKRGKSAKAAAVPAARKKSRAVPDDDDDLDGDDAGDDDDGEEDDVPPAKAAAKKVAAKKTAAAPAGKNAAFEKVRTALSSVLEHESLGKARVLKILKKYGAERAADLEATDYPAVLAACKTALASVAEEEDDDV